MLNDLTPAEKAIHVPRRRSAGGKAKGVDVFGRVQAHGQGELVCRGTNVKSLVRPPQSESARPTQRNYRPFVVPVLSVSCESKLLVSWQTISTASAVGWLLLDKML